MITSEWGMLMLFGADLGNGLTAGYRANGSWKRWRVPPHRLNHPMRDGYWKKKRKEEKGKKNDSYRDADDCAGREVSPPRHYCSLLTTRGCWRPEDTPTLWRHVHLDPSSCTTSKWKVNESNGCDIVARHYMISEFSGSPGRTHLSHSDSGLMQLLLHLQRFHFHSLRFKV